MSASLVPLPDPLYIRVGRRYAPAPVHVVLETARAIVRSTPPVGMSLTSPRLAADYLKGAMQGLGHEEFHVLYLDSRHRLIGADCLFRGTIDGASVHPREVVKAAIYRNAAAVILAHNHPSGVAEPSRADEAITARLRDALALVDVRVVDHLLIGGTECTSLAERGLC